jgi:hypothetical protein
MHYVAAKHGPKGRQTGYVIKNEDTEVVATFRNKDHGYWRFAKTAAERECDRLNRETGGEA